VGDSPALPEDVAGVAEAAGLGSGVAAGRCFEGVAVGDALVEGLFSGFGSNSPCCHHLSFLGVGVAVGLGVGLLTA